MRDYQKIHSDYVQSNLSLREFCKQMNYSYGSMFNRFKERELKTNYKFNHKSKLSYDDVLKIKDYLIEDRMTLSSVSIIFNVSKQLIVRSFKKYNVAYDFEKNDCQLEYDSSFFKEINTELKAYLLGWLYSDGNIHKTSLHLTIQREDKEIIELFKNTIGGTIVDLPKRKETHKDMSKWYATNKFLTKDLKAVGLEENKSYKEMLFPIMPKDLRRHFIRGFFDGDGSIYKSGRNINIKFTCTSLTFLKSIEEEINGQSSRYDFNHKSRVENLIYGTKEDRELICKLFYKDCNYFLTRKRNKFTEYVNTELNNNSNTLLSV